MTTPTTSASPSAGRLARPGRALSYVVVGILLAALLVFFVLPVLWLLLAPSKTADEVVRDNPLSFGSFHQIGAAWKHLFAFQDGAMLTWLRNSAIHSGGSLVLALLVSVPAGYALALTKFRGRKVLLVITLVTMIMPQATLVRASSSLPRDLLSAARIDGRPEWQLFARIALPLAKPVVGLIAFFSFVGNWNNFFLPLL